MKTRKARLSFLSRALSAEARAGARCGIVDSMDRVSDPGDSTARQDANAPSQEASVPEMPVRISLLAAWRNLVIP